MPAREEALSRPASRWLHTRTAALLSGCIALQGCAFTLTAAVGEHSKARSREPQAVQCQDFEWVVPEGGGVELTPGNSFNPAGDDGYSTTTIPLRTTETENRVGKIGPDDVTTTKVTEPAYPPPASESEAGTAKGLGGVFATLGGWLLCGFTLGGICP